MNMMANSLKATGMEQQVSVDYLGEVENKLRHQVKAI